MLALELVRDRESKEPAPELASAAVAAARERGLVLLSCGLYGNVVRVLVPLVIADEDLDARPRDPGGVACRCRQRRRLKPLRRAARPPPPSCSRG